MFIMGILIFFDVYHGFAEKGHRGEGVGGDG
jgi:hypothetical protein